MRASERYFYFVGARIVSLRTHKPASCVKIKGAIIIRKKFRGARKLMIYKIKDVLYYISKYCMVTKIGIFKI